MEYRKGSANMLQIPKIRQNCCQTISRHIKKIPSHTKKARLGTIGTYYLYISYSVQPGFCPSLGFNVIWLLGIG